jgi:3',5'-cyclic AMP phosphodiesterase CpdA
LIGVIPPLAVIVGRATLGAAAHGPIAGPFLLVLLAGLAFWIGRPLVRKAVESFWQLHLTLVFPIFVTVREILRWVAERFTGTRATVEQLERGRRLGTMLGGLLLAVGGVALAWTVGRSLGLQLIDIEGGRPWPLTRAALGNAAIILGLSTAVESLIWVWREWTIRGPAANWNSAPAAAETPSVRVAHVSDLHVVGERYGCRMEAGSEGPRGNSRIRSTLRQLAGIHAAEGLDRILVTGDVTDDGTRAEWVEFLRILRNDPLRDRLSFVPGNHDVNIVDRHNPGRFELPGSAGRALRRLRVVLALDELQGNRARVVDRDSGSLGPLLRDYLREGDRAARLRELAEDGTARGRREMETVWDGIFPLVETAPAPDGYGLILLDSNARSHFALTNAIGVVSPAQLKALKAILRNSPRSAWMILLHHQVVEYPVACIGLTDRIGLALLNACDLLDAIRPHAERCLVLHGHRHRHWIGDSGGVVLCSAPSATLGSHGPEKYRGSFYIHEVGLGEGGHIRLRSSELVRLKLHGDFAPVPEPIVR